MQAGKQKFLVLFFKKGLLASSADRHVIKLSAYSLAWIEATIISPAAARPDPRRPGVSLSYKAIIAAGGRVLRIAHRPHGADILVITAHFDRRAKT